MKLVVASILTLGILFAFLLSILLGSLYVLGIEIPLLLLVGLTGFIFFIQWLISPYISDIVFQWLYKLKWVGIDEIAKRDEEVASFIAEICRKNKIKIPKIGYIDDDNPQSFVYGSAAFNARLVFTEGIFRYLDTEERKAVFGHEIGHIVHRDFIIMTLAAFILALLYHFSRVLLRAKGDRGSGKAAIAGIIALLFYFIGSYILLLLSRIREYFADEFSAKAMGASDPLARALIKIAYGIIARPEEKKELELMYGTRNLGIMDFSAARGIGLSYITGLQLKSWEPVEKTLLFDLKNPWAFINELSSSHPLTAKRIKRLESIHDVTIFDFDRIEEKYPIDKGKLYANFFKDVLFEFSSMFFIAGFLILLPMVFLGFIPLSFSPETLIPIFLSVFFIGLGLSTIAKTNYRYAIRPAKSAKVLELMEDVYASPIRGMSVELKGKIVGRGVPGLIFSEDMMFQDETGLIYMNYEGLVPLFSNLVFALFKLKNFVGKDVEARGWFLRGLAPRIELADITVEGEKIKSRVRTLGIIAGIILILFGLVSLSFAFYF